jgi:hypothetical protein
MNISSNKIIPLLKKQEGSKSLTEINLKKTRIIRYKIIFSIINKYLCKCNNYSNKKVSPTLINI